MPPEAAVAAPASTAARVPPATLAGLLLTLALAALDSNVVGTALPRIVSELGGLAHLSWVVTAFMVASTATTPLYGKLSDLYGRRRMFISSISIFLAGSALCGMAGTMTQLIVFRFLQGLGAGGLISLSQIAIGDLVAPRERGRYQGMFAGVFALASIAGPLLGGIITDLLNWRWIFYINLPVGAGALFLIATGLPRTGRLVQRRIDYFGAVLLTACTVSLLLILSWGGTVYPWNSIQLFALGALWSMLLTLLLAIEYGAPEPMLALPLFANRVFVVAVAVTCLVSAALFGSVVFLPAFFQIVLGASPSASGLMTSPLMAGLIVTSTVGGRVVSRWGRYKIVAVCGLGVALGGFVALAYAIDHTARVALILPPLACLGAGFGMVMPNLTVAIQNAVDHRVLGVATATSAYFRSLGGAVGVAVAGAITTARLQSLAGAAGGDLSGEGGGSFSLQAITTMAPEARAAFIAAYRGAIASTMVTGGVVALVAFAILLGLPERPLRGAGEKVLEH